MLMLMVIDWAANHIGYTVKFGTQILLWQRWFWSGMLAPPWCMFCATCLWLSVIRMIRYGQIRWRISSYDKVHLYNVSLSINRYVSTYQANLFDMLIRRFDLRTARHITVLFTFFDGFHGNPWNIPSERMDSLCHLKWRYRSSMKCHGGRRYLILRPWSPM